MTTRENTRINEKYDHIKHKSGLDLYVFPKNHSTAYAIFAAKFGSCDCSFTNKNGETVVLPDGIAHFLEHKLFENEEGGDAFEQYAEYGGSANAFTSFDKTAYLFSCTENFYNNLEILLDMVTHPYFTDKSVEKEQGIITQEIKMYEDNPRWRSFFNMLGCLYSNHPITKDIAGTVDSIMKITPELMYECHRLFYNLGNMVLCISGDVDTGEVLNILDKCLEQAPEYIPAMKIFDEPLKINKPYATQQHEVALPLYAIGIKCPQDLLRENLKGFAAMQVILNIIFSKSSKFYNDCYEKGIFNKFSAGYSTFRDQLSYIEISGSAVDPEKLFTAIKDEIENYKNSLFTDEEFERAKKVLYSDTVCDYDSTEDIAYNFISFYMDGDDMLDYPDVIASLDKKFTEECFTNYINIDKMCLSTITPKNKEV